MKSKHVGLAGLGITAAAALAIGLQLLLASWNAVRPPAIQSILDTFPSERLLVDSQAMARMDLVAPTLSSLVKPEAVASRETLAAVTGVDYGMFGKRPPKPVVRVAEQAAPAAEPVEPAAPAPYRYSVGMTYVSGNFRYAVVNKRLYQLGARLPNGEKLAEISANAIRIDSKDGPRWVSIYRTNQSVRPPADNG
ncbi:MAG: hypothetical protein LJE84_09620 [Gammaproteobacteria bacterium]|nr:hypothetical protein [Gammaproteobacteria bacterium]